ncbi:MAG: hypothetical protein ABSG89_05125 [Bacteroidales bacterium]|jgi:hypothetical protein
MTFREKYDKLAIGVIAGFLLPFTVAFIAFLAARGNLSMHEWINRIARAHIITHVVSLCVFPNVVIFLLFNYLDMLRASRGVLGVTLFWAVLVFIVYFVL